MVALVVLGAMAAVGGGVVAAAATPVQAPTTAEDPAFVDPDPADDGLDPAAVPAADPAPEGDRSAVDAENRRIWLVVAGLVAVAVALALLTIRYWAQTRPVPVTEPVVADGRAGREHRGRRSRRAVAGADHAAADESWEPRGTGEFDRVVVAPVARQTRPTPDQRRAAYEASRRS